MSTKKHADCIYMDLEGNPLPFHPDDQIQVSNFKKNAKFDYTAIHPLTKTAIVQLWGKRFKQEDRICIGRFNNFNKLNESQRKHVLLNTIKKLQEQITKKDLVGGSTLCGAILTGNKIYTANVGDSLAYLAILDHQGQMFKFYRLNRILHTPTQEKEARRIPDENIYSGRLAGRLALSRAIGDNDFEQYGLLHEPDEIYVDEYKIPTKGHGFVIVASDGLTEGECLTEELLINLIQDTYLESTEVIASKLAVEAYLNGSTDNISVLIAPLHSTSTGAEYAAVFDGHGGDDVSEYLYQKFDDILKNEIHLSLADQ